MSDHSTLIDEDCPARLVAAFPGAERAQIAVEALQAQAGLDIISARILAPEAAEAAPSQGAQGAAAQRREPYLRYLAPGALAGSCLAVIAIGLSGSSAARHAIFAVLAVAAMGGAAGLALAGLTHWHRRRTVLDAPAVDAAGVGQWLVVVDTVDVAQRYTVRQSLEALGGVLLERRPVRP
ncbi:MAG: hypothetical protein KDI16_06930 [Halioglobus sp.]|nr:hypothetical protein [Halioglobus sp.]